jgi:crotonobetainyl-CoA:carnitine CoA-transferase CaiB-like acyl-CoA transferase
VAILAGLLARERGRAGGQRIDLSLLGASLSILVNQAQNAWVGDRAPGRLGNAHPNIVPYETFDTADGAIAVAVGSERQWPRFCQAIDLPTLATDPRFATNGERVDRRVELRSLIAGRLRERPTDEWLTRLREAEVPAGPILDVAAAFATPAAEALGASANVRHPRLGELRQATSPARYTATPASIRRPPPLVGEDRDAILEDLGFGPAEREALRGRGVP